MTKVVHCKRDKYDVFIGRPGVWGNPFAIGRDGSRATVLEKYFKWIYSEENAPLRARARKELRGKVLGCYCFPYRCHGDILSIVTDSAEIE